MRIWGLMDVLPIKLDRHLVKEFKVDVFQNSSINWRSPLGLFMPKLCIFRQVIMLFLRQDVVVVCEEDSTSFAKRFPENIVAELVSPEVFFVSYQVDVLVIRVYPDITVLRSS